MSAHTQLHQAHQESIDGLVEIAKTLERGIDFLDKRVTGLENMVKAIAEVKPATEKDPMK